MSRQATRAQAGSAIALAGLLLALGSPREAAAAQLLPLPLAGAAAISADGSTIVGYRSLPSGSEAARWIRSGGMVGLGVLPGATSSYASAVSADGSVVVGTCDGPGGHQAFRWTAAGGMVGLGDLPGGSSDSLAAGVSADGSVVVGSSQSANGREAFRWTSAGGMVGLGDLPGGDFDSSADAVSGDGSIVVGGGSSGASLDGAEAFRWTSAGGIVSLGDLAGGDFYSVVWGISADCSTAFGYSDSVSAREAFRWTGAQGMVALGMPQGAQSSFAMAASGDGTIIVGQLDYSTLDEHAFIWDAAHGMRPLEQVLTGLGVDLTGWTLWEATGVSADGHVVIGNGLGPSGPQPWMALLAPDCSDGIDNDGDGLVDYPADPGCASPTDPSEHDAALPCDNGIDDDGDGLVDFKADGSGDPGCAYSAFPTENPACQDGLDNDGDGKIDFDGGASAHHGVALGLPDPACWLPFRQTEVDPQHCGLGAELAFVLVGLEAARRARRSGGLAAAGR